MIVRHTVVVRDGTTPAADLAQSANPITMREGEYLERVVTFVGEDGNPFPLTDYAGDWCARKGSHTPLFNHLWDDDSLDADGGIATFIVQSSETNSKKGVYRHDLFLRHIPTGKQYTCEIPSEFLVEDAVFDADDDATGPGPNQALIGVPAGGLVGQVLTVSDEDPFAMDWEDLPDAVTGLPSQTDHAGHALFTNGSAAGWRQITEDDVEAGFSISVGGNPGTQKMGVDLGSTTITATLSAAAVGTPTIDDGSGPIAMTGSGTSWHHTYTGYTALGYGQSITWTVAANSKTSSASTTWAIVNVYYGAATPGVPNSAFIQALPSGVVATGTRLRTIHVTGGAGFKMYIFTPNVLGTITSITSSNLPVDFSLESTVTVDAADGAGKLISLDALAEADFDITVVS